MSDQRLRVGVLIDDWMQPRWVANLVASVQDSGCADICLVVLNGDGPEMPARTWRQIWAQRAYWAYRIYSRLDIRLFPVKVDAFIQTSLADLLPDVAVITVQPKRTRHSDYFADTDVARIRESGPDVLLRFGFRILRGEILRAARYGVWSYHHGDNQVNRGGPPGFWEVVNDDPVTGSVLQILNEELDAGTVLYRSYAATNRRAVKRNKNHYYWKSSQFVARKLQEVYEEGEQALCDESYGSTYDPYSEPLYRNPTNRELLPALVKLGGRAARQKVAEVTTREQWFVAYQFRPAPAVSPEAFYRFRALLPPKDRFWADPFPVEQGGKHFLFVEEYLYARRKGHIAVLELGVDGLYGSPAKVLDKEYHLSYPYLFEWQGQHWMIPESAANRRVELYKCTNFPGEWEPAHVLLDNVDAVDATLVEFDGRWWMFVNMRIEGMANYNDELYLYCAPTPMGPWTPHRRNPVKSDVRNARPAGRPFWWKGELYRPAQDCSVRYGYAIVLNKITKLDTERYAESEVSRILPHWRRGLLGNHTLNRAGNLTVIDGLHRIARA